MRMKFQEDPRPFLLDPDQPLHKLLNGEGLGLQVRPEELTEFVDVEVLQRLSESFESKLQKEREDHAQY